MNTTYKSKVYDISTLEGQKQAEQAKQRLYSKYNSVKTVQAGTDKIYFIGSN